MFWYQNYEYAGWICEAAIALGVCASLVLQGVILLKLKERAEPTSPAKPERDWSRMETSPRLDTAMLAKE